MCTFSIMSWSNDHLIKFSWSLNISLTPYVEALYTGCQPYSSIRTMWSLHKLRVQKFSCTNFKSNETVWREITAFICAESCITLYVIQVFGRSAPFFGHYSANYCINEFLNADKGLIIQVSSFIGLEVVKIGKIKILITDKMICNYNYMKNYSGIIIH